MKPALIIGEWEVDPIDGQICRFEEVRRLRPKAMAVLLCLADRPDQLVERDVIIEQVWGRELITDEPLTTCIAELRRTLDDSAKSPQYIQTVPKRGYRLVATVREGNSSGEEPSLPPSNTPSPIPERADRDAAAVVSQGEIHKPQRQPADYATKTRSLWPEKSFLWPAILTSMVVLLATWIYQQSSAPPDLETFQTETAASQNRPTIAVLPFINMSPDPENDYFGDGIAEEVLNSLTRIKGLRVRSRTSSFALKNQNLEAETIASRLRVSHILEGSIRRSGNTLRISAQLVDIDADTHIWSEVFEKDVENIFEIQGEIATQVSAALEIALDMEQQRQLANPGTTEVQAYALYLRGRQQLARRTSLSISSAVEYFSRALDLDPEYAQAYLGLADANLLLPQYNNRPDADYMDKALEAIETALKINPDLGEAYATLGSVLEEQGDYAAAEEAFKVALERAPYYPTTYHWYGFLLYRMARLQEAEEMLQLALEQDPLSSVLQYGMGAILVAQGRFNEAEDLYQHIIKTDPEFSWAYEGMGELNWNGRGQLHDAAKWYQKAIRYDPDSSYFQALLGAIYLDMGDPTNAKQSIDIATRLQSDSFLTQVHRALLHLYEYETDEAYNIALQVVEDDPRNYLAMAIVRTLILKDGDPEAAKSPYLRAYPELFREDVIVDIGNFQAAVDLAVVLQRTGEEQQADLLLQSAWNIAEKYPRHGLPYRLSDVKILALQGQTIRASKLLQRSVSSGWRPYWWFLLEHDPALQTLHGEPRYQEIVASIHKGVAEGR